MTVEFFAIPLPSFDFFSFNFHVPICALAAKHNVPAASQTIRKTNELFIFMRQMKDGNRAARQYFLRVAKVPLQGG
jgi:hypothetical protein